MQQYERGVIFVLGRLIGAKGPGIFLVPPFISRITKVDLRIVTLTIAPQEVITRDNVTVKVTAVIYFYVVDPAAAITNVVSFLQATTQIGQTTLRNVLGQSELDELLAQRNKINRVSYRLPTNWRKQQQSLVHSPLLYNCATCKRSRKSLLRKTRRSFSPCRLI